MDDKLVVLYADDDADDREMMGEIFQNFPDYQLLTFENGLELLSYLNGEAASRSICLILLDINMPLFTGVETLMQLKKEKARQTIPIVLYSTGGSPADRAAAESMQVEIVTKSFSFKETQKTVESLLAHCSVR